MAGRSRSSWAFDMHHIVPSALYNDIDIRRALELAGYSLQSDGNKIALFWNSEKQRRFGRKLLPEIASFAMPVLAALLTL